MKRLFTILACGFAALSVQAVSITVTFVNDSATTAPAGDGSHHGWIQKNGVNYSTLASTFTVGPGSSFVVSGWSGYNTNDTVTWLSPFHDNDGVWRNEISSGAVVNGSLAVTLHVNHVDPSATNPPTPVYTNTTVTVNNAGGSGVVGYANFTYNGVPYSSFMLCPGQSATQSHICSVVDPVDSFTGAFAPLRPSTTNITGTVLNDLADKVVNAYWKFNGNVIKSEYLMPGQSDSYTFAYDLCGAGNGSFTWGYTVVGTSPDPANPNPFGNATNSQGSFASSTPTNGAFYAGTGTSGGGYSPFPSDYVFTNNIAYPVGLTNLNGLALDATLRAGQGQLHEDNLNEIKAASVLHQDNSDLIASIGLLARTNPIILNAPSNVFVMNFPSNSPAADYTGVLTNSLSEGKSFHGDTTNLLGEMIRYQGIISNDMYVITQWMTNQVPPTNQFTVQFPTNGVFVFSNQPSTFTNYATESTLAGISNAFFNADGIGDTNFAGALETNFDDVFPTNPFASYHYEWTGPTNLAMAEAEANNSQISTIETTVQAFIAGFVDPSGSMDDEYPAVDMTYTFPSFGGGGPLSRRMMTSGVGGNTMDFDPLHNESLAALFALAKTLFTWGIAAMYLQKITTDGFKLVMILNTAHGVNPSAVTAELKKS